MLFCTLFLLKSLALSTDRTAFFAATGHKKPAFGLESGPTHQLYCESESGERFIVEVQQAPQDFFVDRTLYYAAGAIQQQARIGRTWAYELQAVYVISILNHVFDRRNTDRFEHRVELTERATGRVFYPKLLFIYLEVPKFNTPLENLSTDYERWLYAFKMLAKLDKRPAAYRDAVFERLFEIAEIARMSTQERQAYDQSLRRARDAYAIEQSVARRSREEGREIGKTDNQREQVFAALAKGHPKALILEFIGCTEAQFETWKAEFDQQQ